MQLTLAERTFAVLDRRLERHADRPVALALSGGGDSMALLDLTARWCAANGRRLLALTVDHRLNPDSDGWTRFARDAARTAGVDWSGLAWQTAKPSTGLPAAARRARHALIADAAREAGARVILFAHTADDGHEADRMRAEGSSVGRPREWAPSPVWPEGRGLMLLRPLLAERRSDLRDWLRAQGRTWIEDPANADDRSARARARKALASEAASPFPDTVPASRDGNALAGFSAVSGTGLDRRRIGQALLCMGGGERPPRRERLDHLLRRLTAGEALTASLSGARFTGDAAQWRICREAGDYVRAPAPPLPLLPHTPVVWDGRYEITADTPGLCVVPAQGRLARLEAADRAALDRLPARERPTLPVLERDDGLAPVLAWRGATVRALAPLRFDLAQGGIATEADLARLPIGESPSRDLFQSTGVPLDPGESIETSYEPA